MNKYKITGILLHFIYKVLNITVRKKYYECDNFEINSQNVVVFWHRKIFSVCNSTRIIKKKASMVSASKDGEILSELLKKEGNEIIRGSSNKDNIKALKEAIKYVKEGYTLGIAVDGPRGPIYEPKPGAIFIAQKTGLPIVPIGTYCNRAWVFEKMWDKLEIPKPFSICIHYTGEPFYLDKSLSLEDGIRKVKFELKNAEKKAKNIYKEKFFK